MSRAQMLEDYRVAREAGEVAREARDMGWATERAMQRAAGAPQPITLRQWMRQAQRPSATPDDVADLERSEWEACQDAHAAVAEAHEHYLRAVAARDALFLARVQDGHSLGAVGRMVGISRQAVHAVLERARKAG